MVCYGSMNEQRGGLTDAIASTNHWIEFKDRYICQLEGRGDAPFQEAAGVLTPIPPDTQTTIVRYLHGYRDTGRQTNVEGCLGAFRTELDERGISLSVSPSRAFSEVVEMRFSFQTCRKA